MFEIVSPDVFHKSWVEDLSDFFKIEKNDDETYLCMNEHTPIVFETLAEFSSDLQSDEFVKTIDLSNIDLVQKHDSGEPKIVPERLEVVLQGFLGNSGTLTAANLSHNSIGINTWRTVHAFCESMKSTRLQVLDLSSNNLLTPGRRIYKGVMHLGRLIQEMPLLRKLRLSSNDLDADCCKIFAESLIARGSNPSAQLTPLEELDFSENPLLYNFNGTRDPIGWAPFCNSFFFLSSLTCLNLSDMNLDYMASLDVFAGLNHMTKLKVLLFNRNELQVTGAKELGTILESNQCIRYLRISGCQIQDEGASAIFHGLHENQSLQYLDLSQNELTEDILPSVEGLSEINISIMDICFDDNEIAVSVKEDLRTLVYSNHELCRIQQDPAFYPLEALPPLIYPVIFQKLKRLSRLELKKLQNNSQFMAREDMRNHLLLLCPPTQEELVQQALEKKLSELTY